METDRFISILNIMSSCFHCIRFLPIATAQTSLLAEQLVGMGLTNMVLSNSSRSNGTHALITASFVGQHTISNLHYSDHEDKTNNQKNIAS